MHLPILDMGGKYFSISYFADLFIPSNMRHVAGGARLPHKYGDSLELIHWYQHQRKPSSAV